MKKIDLITKVVKDTGMTRRQAEQAIDSVFRSITYAVKEEGYFQMMGFGKFEVHQYAARKGRNPQTGEEIEIPSRNVPTFKPGRPFKRLVNETRDSAAF